MHLLFCLNGCHLGERKVDIPLGICLTSGNKPNVPTSPFQVNLNNAVASPSTWLDTKQPPEPKYAHCTW